MLSNKGIWADVNSGKLAKPKALALLEEMPGGRDTQTYRRVKRYERDEAKVKKPASVAINVG